MTSHTRGFYICDLTITLCRLGGMQAAGSVTLFALPGSKVWHVAHLFRSSGVALKTRSVFFIFLKNQVISGFRVFAVCPFQILLGMTWITILRGDINRRLIGCWFVGRRIPFRSRLF